MHAAMEIARPGTIEANATALQIQTHHHSVQPRPRCHSAVMSAGKTFGDGAKWRRRRSPAQRNDDDDCGSLAWLLNFKLDELVNVKVTFDEPIYEHVSVVSDVPPASRKPPYTYPELIERALRERGELTVSAIYQWISDRFPYYKANDERWKNSVRHNLSINPHFRKGARAPHGAGHLWSLAANAIDLLPNRHSPIAHSPIAHSPAAHSPVYMSERTEPRYLQEAQVLEYPKQASSWCLANTQSYRPIFVREKNEQRYLHGAHIIDCPKVIVLDEAAIAAANILPDQDLFTGSTMFLNPVSSEQVVRECGLLVVD